MLFTAKINQVQTAIEDRLDLIAQLENQIESLRQENLEQQQFLQALGSAENAAESALTQLQTALAMTTAVDPDMAQSLKDAALAVFETEKPILPPPTDEGDADDDSVTVDVDVMSVETVTYGTLRISELKAICRKNGLSSTGNKSDLIARLNEFDQGGSEPASIDQAIAA